MSNAKRVRLQVSHCRSGLAAMPRSGRVLALAFALLAMALAAALLPPAPASAQTVSTLVSNTGQAPPSSAIGAVTFDLSHAFTTGSNSHGYTLSSVDIVSIDAEGDDFTAAIWTVDSSGDPSASHATLTAPSSFASGTLRFTAPANTSLAANTTYAVVMSIVGTEDVDYGRTESAAEDSGAATGWSLADNYKFKSGGTWTTAPYAMRLAVRGSAKTSTNTVPVLSLVKNTGQGNTGSMDARHLYGQGFSTGANSFGYVIYSVDIVYAGTEGTPFDIAIWTADSNGKPVVPVTHDFARPSSFSSGTLTFTASTADPSITVFEPSSNYAVVVMASSGDVSLGTTTSTGMDTGGASGWDLIGSAYTIENHMPERTEHKLRIEIKGQTIEALVSNTAQTGKDALNLRGSFGQSFVTGGKFTVKSVAVDSAGSKYFSVSIWNVDSNRRPRQRLLTLTPPRNFTAGPMVFTVPGRGLQTVNLGVYAVVVETHGHTRGINSTTSDSEDLGKQTGWSIEDAYTTRSGSGWTTVSSGRALMISVNGVVGHSPGKPGSPEASFIGNGQVRLDWTAAGSGTTTVNGYLIEASERGSAKWWYWYVVASNVGSATTSHTHTRDSLPHDQLRYRITSLSALGMGDTSDPVSVAAGGVLISNAGQAHGFATNTETPTKIAQTFTTGSGAFTLTSVEVETASSNTGFDASLWSTNSNGSPNEKLFNFTVTAPDGHSNATVALVAPENTVIGPSKSYAIVLEDLATKLASISGTSSDSEDAGGVTGWSIANTQWFYIPIPSAWTAQNAGSMRIAVKGHAGTAPNKPTGLTAQATGQSRIHLSWTAPAANGGSAITGYRIEAQADGDWTDVVANTGSADTTYAHSGLPRRSTRTYRVSAINGSGTGPPSDSAMETADVLVSTAATYGANFTSVGGARLTQEFTTGSVTAGYRLTAMDIVSQDPDGDGFTVAIWAAADDGTPTGSAALIELAAPASFTSGPLRFTAPADTMLAANTDYVIVVTPNDTALTAHLLLGNSTTGLGTGDEEDPGAESGWSVADDSYASAPGGTWTSLSPVLAMAMRGETVFSPVFNPMAVTRSIDENPTAGQNVGAPVSATHAGNKTLTYAIGGADATSFDIDMDSGQITTRAGVTYDHESKASYTVTVTASDGDQTGSATVTINVADVNEPPPAPAAPTVAGAAGSTTGLSVGWTAPVVTGRPAVASYDLRYREGLSGPWTDGPQDRTGLTATIGSLEENTWYQVQVRATNDEGDSPWSLSGLGNTNPANTSSVPVVPASAWVSGTTLEVTFTRDLGAAADLANSAFGVTATPDSGDASTVSLTGSPVIAGKTLTLTLEGEVAERLAVVAVGYTRPSTGSNNRLVAAAGDVVPNFAAFAVERRLNPPRNLRASATGKTQIGLSWDGPSNVDPASGGLAYRIDVSSDGSTWTTLVASQTERTYAHTGLPANSTRQYRVSTVVSGEPRVFSEAVRDTTNVLLSNVHQDTVGGHPRLYKSYRHIYQLFTTGSEPNNYRISGVEVISADEEGDAFDVEIWRINVDCLPCGLSRKKSGVVARLNRPSGPGAFARGPVLFTVPSNVVLAADTTYAVVLIWTGNATVKFPDRRGAGLDSGAASGWSLHNQLYFWYHPQHLPMCSWTSWITYITAPIKIRGGVSAAQSAPSNIKASGHPVISGDARIYETLSVSTTRITDLDGMENATFTYQWLADGKEISFATGQTYTVAVEDDGLPIAVRVSFTDDDGNEESVTSEPTDPVEDPGLFLESATVYGTSLKLRYPELLNELVDLPETAFTVTVNGAVVTVSDSSVSRSVVTLTLASAVIAGDRVTVSYEQPEGNLVIGDLSGRAAEPFTDEVARPPLTASVNDAPESHDGSASLTFELRFSEEINLSYVTLRDHALTATGGELTVVRRLNQRSNLGWEIAVQPSGNDAVTLVLSPTTDCDAEGAICANDRRMLSGRVEVTVAGPSGQQSDQQESQENSPATGTPTVSGTVRVGETLTASTSGIADADGLTNVSYSYEWLADDSVISGATGSTYTLASGDAGKTVKVRVSFTDDAGNAETVTSAATQAVARPLFTASASNTPESHDGSASFTFELRFSEEFGISYVTLRDHAFTESGGEVTGVSRLTQGSNVGWRITVEPSGNDAVTLILPITTDCEAEGAICTDDGRMLSGRVEVAVAGPSGQQRDQQETQENSPATGRPTISGTARVGETLTASTSGIADADGLTNVSYSYQWLADDVEISGATGSTYTLVAGDQGKAVKVRVSFTDDAGNAESLTGAATEAVAAANSPATGTPTISGTARVGETLMASTTGIADADGLTNVAFTYQWLADDAEISGATGSTYELVAGDQGKTVSVRVSFTDDAGNAESLTSGATGTVARPPFTASAQEVPASHDGSASFTFELRFSEEFGLSYVTLRDHAFTVTGGEVTGVSRLAQGSNVGWRITVEPSGNDAVTLILPPTTDCAATGAICTGDGRTLSNETTVTVAGP